MCKVSSRRACLIVFLPLLLSAVADEDTSKPNQRFTANEALHQKYKLGIQLCFDWEYEKSLQVFREIQEADPDNPAADFLLGALTLNTIHYYDPTETSEEEEFVYKSFDRAIEKADALLKKDPDDFNANFFKGSSIGFRGIFRLQKLQVFSAASDARSAKACMERAIAMNPEFYDAYLGLGIYNYFVDALPNVLKFMRVLLFIPNGDKRTGLKQLRIAADKATYSRTYALVVLESMYNNFEEDFDNGNQLLKELSEKCPRHPWFALERTTVTTFQYNEFAESERLLAAIIAREKEPNFGNEIHATARYRLARTKFQNLKPREALADLEQLIASNPKSPKGILAGAHLLSGRILKRIGNETEAKEHLAKVTELPDSYTYRHERMDNRVIIPKQVPLHQLAAQESKRTVPPQAAESYLLATDGLNLLRNGNLKEAEPLIRKSLSLKGASAISRWVHANWLAENDQYADAAEIFESLAKPGVKPSWIHADSHFRSAVLFQKLGNRDKSKEYLKRQLAVKRFRLSQRQAARKALAGEAELDTKWPSF